MKQITIKGFRISGTFGLNDITYSDIISYIGPAQNDKHTIKYKYIRHDDVDSTPNKEITNNVYIDTLANDPSISGTPTQTAEVKSVIYTMGIPSVKTFDVSISRTYKDINSANMYVPGNRIIAKITEINKVNKDNDTEIILARDTASGSTNKIINNTGEYAYTIEDFHTATNDYYKNCYYNSQIGINSSGAYTSNTDLDITEQVLSLKKTVSITPKNKISVDHFFDMNSYNNIGISSISRKFNFTDVYEITDATELAKLNTDLGDIGITQYTNHENKIKDWTLLYLDGKFRTNADKTYPDINDYVYDSVNIPSKYDKGTTSYDTTGNSSGDSGYKWIVFRIDKTSSFVKSASKIGGGVSKPYIDVPGLLINHGFSSSIYSDSNGIGKGFGSQNVIGFVRINSSKKAVDMDFK